MVWLGAFLGALAAGGAGFAFALTASSVWLHALDPVHTTTLVVACGTILHCTLVWPMRRTIEPARLLPFALGGLAGIPIGVAILSGAPVSAIKVGLGAFLVIYSLYATLAPRLPVIEGGGRAADAGIGFVGGVLGGLGGFSGVVPTIWTQLRGWPKDVARGVYQPYILLAHFATLGMIAGVALDRRSVLLVASSLPALAAGSWLGWRIYGRLDDLAFRRLLCGMLFLSGIALALGGR